MRKYWFTKSAGTDTAGVPITVVKMGGCDVAGLVREVGEACVTLHYICELERSMALAAQAWERGAQALRGPGCRCGVVEIHDLGADGVPGYSSRGYSAAKAFVRLMARIEGQYPERSKAVFIVRAPMIFPAFYRIVASLIPQSTKDKISITGSSGWTARMMAGALLARGSVPPWLDESQSPAQRPAPDIIGGCVPLGAGNG